MTATFRSSDICAVAGLSKRQLQWMREHRFIRPLRRAGLRHVHLWSEGDALVICIMAELRRRGIQWRAVRQRITEIARLVTSYLGDGMPQDDVLIVLGSDGPQLALARQAIRLGVEGAGITVVSLTDQLRKIAARKALITSQPSGYRRPF